MNIVLTPNIVQSIPDDRDFLYVPSPYVSPSDVDLKPDVYEVDNQLSIGSCTANASTSACEFILKKKGAPISLSRLFTYYDTRNNVEDRPGQEGASTRDAVRSLYHTGTCPEIYWPYIVGQEDVRPSEAAYAAVNGYKVDRYEAINLGLSGMNSLYSDRSVVLHAVKSAIAEGIPVIFSMAVGQQIRTLTGPWRTHHMDSVYSGHNGFIGGHAILIIGYDDSVQKFLVENSWGSQWGDGGFFGLDYATFLTDAYDAFIIRSFAGFGLNNEIRTQPSAPEMFWTNTPVAPVTYDPNPSAETSRSEPVRTDIFGGTPPYTIEWGQVWFGNESTSGASPLSTILTHDWAPLNDITCPNPCTVRDSSYPNQQVVSRNVTTRFVRGQIKPPQTRYDIITDYYRSILGREPDMGGLEYWASSGLPLKEVRRGFIMSEEYSAQMNVFTLYRDILQRTPDQGGYSDWFNSRLPMPVIRDAFFASGEYLSQGD